MKYQVSLIISVFLFASLFAQQNPINISAEYQPLPLSLQVFKMVDSIDGKPVVMYYAEANLTDDHLRFYADTTLNRRLTPSAFYKKNQQPLLVVNTSFFSFGTHQNLNVVVSGGKILGYNQNSRAGRGNDTLTYLHRFQGALGISKKRKADVAWVFSDTSRRFLYASQTPVPHFRDSLRKMSIKYLNRSVSSVAADNSNFQKSSSPFFSRWKMRTAVGGGPVLVQNGKVLITNNEEIMFGGEAVDDRHPRTAMGYTADDRLIVFVCEGRSETSAGLSLIQLARIMRNLGCVEALNLDGGGSTCLLINGKSTNIPSSKGEQRAVPSVFLISEK